MTNWQLFVISSLIMVFSADIYMHRLETETIMSNLSKQKQIKIPVPKIHLSYFCFFIRMHDIAFKLSQNSIL